MLGMPSAPASAAGPKTPATTAGAAGGAKVPILDGWMLIASNQPLASGVADGTGVLVATGALELDCPPVAAASRSLPDRVSAGRQSSTAIASVTPPKAVRGSEKFRRAPADAYRGWATARSPYQ